MNPWGGGGMDSNQMLMNNPMALVNNLVGAIMQQQQQMGVGMQPQMMDSRMNRGDDLRRRRSRSPPRRMRTPPRRRDARPNNRDRSRSPRRRTNHQSSRKRSPPADRPDHEVYIGNYPANYTEAQLRNLFSEFMVDVKGIRMKSDGHKVFSFAEVADQKAIDLAIENMDGKEIQGRRLRVRGSKKTGNKAEAASSSSRSASSHNKEKESKKDDRPKEKEKEREKTKQKEKKPWIPKLEDSRLHLVNAFIQFIKREIKCEEGGSSEMVSMLETCNDALTQAYNIPDDDSLKVTRDIEDIFFKAVRLELKPPKENEQDEEKIEDVKENDDNDNQGVDVKNEDVEMKEEDAEEIAEVENALDEDVSGDADTAAADEEVEEDDGMADLENCLAQEELEQEEPSKQPEPEKRTSSSSNRGKPSRGRRGRK